MISDTPVSGEIRLENRYIKGEEISRYASTIVYKAIDRKKGIEVAWNQIQIVDTNVQKLMHEIDLFSSLRDPHTITFLDKCNISDPLCLVFTTELMTCSLRDFTLKANGVSLAVIKDWCTQVLEGLRYLHNIDPPVIHRDIQSNNLFFDGSKGLVKIGVLGFETIADMNETPNSIPGAPRFMAPEFDNEEKLYNVKVDIWAFGMCFIELTTLEYPYTECEAVSTVRQNVIKGIKPRAMFKISDPLLFDFIWGCLECDPNKRFSAEQLLNHTFIVEKDENDLFTFVKIRDPEEVDQLAEQYGTTKEGWLAYALRNAAFCKSGSEDQNINISNTEPLIDSDNGKEPSTSSQFTISRHQKHKSEINHSSEDELVFPDDLVTSDDELLISSPDVNDNTKNNTNGPDIDPDKWTENSIKQNPLKGFSKYKNIQSIVDLSGSEDVLIEDISLSFSENDSPSAGSPRMFTNLRNLNAEAKIPESLATLKHQAVLSPSREKKVTAKVDKLVKRNLILFEQNAESPQSPKKLPKQ